MAALLVRAVRLDTAEQVDTVEVHLVTGEELAPAALRPGVHLDKAEVPGPAAPRRGVHLDTAEVPGPAAPRAAVHLDRAEVYPGTAEQRAVVCRGTAAGAGPPGPRRTPPAIDLRRPAMTRARAAS